MKPEAFSLGGTWAGVTAKETDRRSVRAASKVRMRDIITIGLMSDIILVSLRYRQVDLALDW